MKNKRIAMILFAVFAVCIVFSVVGIASAGGTEPINTKKGIVWVYTQFSDGENNYGASGTGWAVGKPNQPVEYIITNGHVVAGPVTYGGSIQIYFSAAENDFVYGTVEYYSPQDELDIAIIKLPTPTTKRSALVLQPSKNVKIGETVYALGYPGLASDMQSFSAFDMEDISITTGVISKSTVPSWAQHKVFQTDTYINHGNSGGPMVDRNGFVVGINTSGMDAVDAEGQTIPMGIAYAIQADELIKILDAERIAYTVQGYNNWMLFLFIPLAAVALLAGFYFMKKDKKGSKETSKKAATKNNPNAGKVCLRGVTGKYAGQTFELDASRLTLGRDASRCNIVYPDNTPGISSNHCSIYYDAKEDCFLLTDNGSTYGTFLGNGQKLSANVSEKLYVGDLFYLGDVGNKFIIGKE